MKILFANARPLNPFNVGGDGVSIHTILRYLTGKNHSCLAVGAMNALGNYERPSLLAIIKTLHSMKIKYQFGIRLLKRRDNDNNNHRGIFPKISVNYTCGYPCKLISTGTFFSELSLICDNFKPDLILTQLDKADEVIRLAYKKHVPSILYVHDLEDHNYILLQKAIQYHCGEVIYASGFAKKQFSSLISCPQKILYPPVYKKDYFVKRSNPQYITMINPVLLKGGHTFRQIVERMKTQKFLCLPGWYDPMFDQINLQGYTNLTLIPKQNDMKSIYKQTKILLIPSIWRECCPRVIIEAALNGIICIASNRGGVAEALGDGGILIDDFLNVNTWVGVIENLLKSPKTYNKLQIKARAHAQKFLVENILPKFERSLKKKQ